METSIYEEVYMKIPLGYPVDDKKLVCKLHKNLYGLRQASRQWYAKFASAIQSWGFYLNLDYTSLFRKDSGLSLIVLLVYIDDIIVAIPSFDLTSSTKMVLEKPFKLKVPVM